jgi:hypothetical protein
MWHVPVSDENLTIEKGDGMLKTYEFGNEEFIHLVSIQKKTDPPFTHLESRLI